MNPHLRKQENEVDGLRFINDFGWLRSMELGKLMWPDSAASRIQADRFLRSLFAQGLVLERHLPERAGRAFIVSTKGAKLLRKNGIEASTGKSLGRFSESTRSGAGQDTKKNLTWLPSPHWEHDLLGHGVLCELYKKGFEIYSEHELKRAGLRKGLKIPDGLAVKDDLVVWVEIENARKTGRNMKWQSQHLIAATAGLNVMGFRTNTALVAYAADSRDKKGFLINHRLRISNSVASIADDDVPLLFAECELLGAGVKEVKFTNEIIESDRSIAYKKQLELYWRPMQGGGYEANYDGFYLQVGEGGREYETPPWIFYGKNEKTGEEDDIFTENITEAKAAAAKWVWEQKK